MSDVWAYAYIGDEKAIARAIEATILDTCIRINNRDFDLPTDIDANGWTRFSNDFVYSPEYQPILAQDSRLAVEELERKGAKNLIELFRAMTVAYPEYRLVPIDYNTQVHEKAAWAESYVTIETTGLGDVTRQSVGVFEWKRDKAKRWWITRYHGMAGMAGD
ncbi:hypothetical protein CLAFUW4_10094 [Fulvia fulva]|uniref:Uncharacterized protein n=1 Tax=Passalora fulva TaxID=5499 RepID=A0A9Q8LEQ3_PASFU|nr:uncharacterized protein CLAFUR5_04707 [Fulvia fulva]KAK4615820.1 hypothetical protein CLAFUR4_10098 [Fulvia fulva]KAK4616462.1 hypothetical protein CLAFUR0_10096 [Fulvia fulva]UJO16176.1 hypothetical protein CLAFUR5_04707 [Fulvia fulva]WPV19278.1 hypothetical protein CLAFUW4_10094 [Fulvia fulva]WPV33902.1 hypothetical protein CLAFUW7_10095 [Fulvia fulva]